MDIDSGRRRFLELAGTGAAATLAGCSALSGNGQTDPNATVGGDDGGSDTVAIAVQPDRKQLRERQQAIRSKLQAGDISRQKAQQRLATAQQELLSEAVATFRQRATSSEALRIGDTLDQFGVLLVSGSADALVDALAFTEVNGLFPQAAFERAKSRAQQAAAPQRTGQSNQSEDQQGSGNSTSK